MFLKPGQIIRFTYQHHVTDAATGDKYKEVLVLHPHWQGKVHGIDLKRLSPAQREVLEVVMNWDWRKHKDGQQHRIPLVNDIIRRMDPKREVKNPKIFYIKFVKPFLGRTDAYRQYYPGQMTGVSVVKDAQISTGKPEVERPLFGKPEDKKDQEKQKVLTPGEQRLASLKSRMMGSKPASPATPAAPPRPAAPPSPAMKPLPPGAAKTGVAAQSGASARLAALKAKAGIK